MIALIGLLLTGAPQALVSKDENALEGRLASLAASVAKLEASSSPPHPETAHLTTDQRLAVLETALAHLAQSNDPDEDPERLMDDFQLVAASVSEELSGSHQVCEPIRVSQVGVNENVCVRVSYHTGSTPSDNTVGISVTANGNHITSYSMNAASLLRRCFPIPYIPVATICMALSNTHISMSSFSTTIGLSLYARIGLPFGASISRKVFGPVGMPRLSIP